MAIFLTARQRAIVKGTIQEARRRYGDGHAGAKASRIAVMTMFTESGARVLANINVPVSLKIPHDLLDWTSDGLGHDHASVGSYQQQTGTAWTVPQSATTMNSPNGWGTPYELMDPPVAAGKFFDAMEDRHPNLSWVSSSLDPWIIAQDVQGSAFTGTPNEFNHYSSVRGGNYQLEFRRAWAAVALMWAFSSPNKTPKPIPAPKPKPKPTPKPGKPVITQVRPGQYLGALAANWRTTPQQIVAWNKAKYPSLVNEPNLIKIGWKLRVR